MEIFSYYLFFPGFAAIILLFIIVIRVILRKKSILKNKPYLYLIPTLFILLLSFSFYLLARASLAEYYFKKSLKSKTVKEIYDYQKLSITTNPYIEKYRIRFSQTNLIIANSLMDKAKNQEASESSNIINEMSPQDKQTATKAIQAAIEEAKAAVKLDHQNPTNWANLGNTYRNLLNIAENADSWAISSYQRAIIIDPQNPDYRLALGGVYYLLKKHDEAIKTFQQAVELKPDWPNPYYNLAWAYYQKGEKQKAIANMEITISLLSSQNNSSELSKAQKDLEEFKK